MYRKSNYGKLRVKMESSQFQMNTYEQHVQTWDGVLQGERLLTMSCSDKIVRWNVLGMQGSLLSTIIEPIYLNSIIIGNCSSKKLAIRYILI